MQNAIRVLIIEDREDDAELMVLELEMAGFELHWQRVENRADYLAQLNAEVDVILADYNLPQFTAPKALALLHEAGLDIPFIVVTGTISEEVAVACIKQGAADYLLKDRLSRLGEAVRHALAQRDLQRANRAAESKLRIMERAISSSINAIALADLDGLITYVNEAFLHLWKFESENEVLGRSLARLWLDSGEAGPVLSALSEGRGAAGEMQAARQDGSQIALQFSASVVLDSDGRSLSMMGIFIDITEQKKAEVARREAEILRIELEKERELRDLKSRFVAMVVHDFRNPLASIQLALNALKQSFDRLEPGRRMEKISLGIEQVKRLNRLLEDVLMIGEIEATASKFAPQRLDLHGFCAALLLEQMQLSQGHHEIAFEAPDRPILTDFDPNLMARALTNLLSNAIKYSPEGTTVTLRLAQDAEHILLSVIDQGIGIPPNEQKRLFDSFFRASNVGSVTGTGLGLAIVKQVVDLHHGDVHCRSELNRGTTFTMALPLAMRQPVSSSAASG